MPSPSIVHVELVKPLLELSDCISIAAIFLGPVIAIQLQKFIEQRKQVQERREGIFRTLMATRGETLSPHHVGALNRIDLDFSSEKRYQKVIEAWKEYFDHLHNGDREQPSIWATTRLELFTNLLYEMGHSLGYSFDRVLIKRNIYSPEGHGIIEREDTEIRQGMARLFRGEDALPISFPQFPQDEAASERQKELHDLMVAYYTAKMNRKERNKD
jgi:hypothetical protein